MLGLSIVVIIKGSSSSVEIIGRLYTSVSIIREETKCKG
jgi:hypothetical protein